MAFYACPMDTKIRDLFGARPELLKKRVPIHLRAELARLRSPLSYDDALSHLDKNPASFKLGNNDFALFKYDPRYKDVIARAVANLGSLAENAFFGIGFRYEGYSFPIMRVISTRKPVEGRLLMRKLPLISAQEGLFYVDFSVHMKELHLAYIKSFERGFGGKALVGIYNTAKETGCEQIKFNITQANDNARRFYFRMDFGNWTDPEMKNWTLNIRGGPSYFA